MKILGIETSCDETAAAVIEFTTPDQPIKLLSNAVFSSMDLHTVHGGVVPEIAARSHIESIIPVIEKALENAFGSENGDRRMERARSGSAGATPQSPILNPQSEYWDEIDAIAVTYGAGLGGCLLVGVMTARTLAIEKNKPLYACNHVEGHVYANFITEISGSENGDRRMERARSGSAGATPQSPILNPQSEYKLPAAAPKFPVLALIVSGGHSQLALFRDHFDYTLLGQTQDDAIGEAFDKVAKIIGLPYPGGPSVGKKAMEGNALAYKLPKSKMTGVSPALAELRKSVEHRALSIEVGSDSMLNARDSVLRSTQSSYDFSFSGIKTAVLRTAQHECGKDFTFPSKDLAALLSEAQKADIAASFQRVAIETVVDKTIQAFEEFSPASVVIAGGVASSPELRRQLAERLPIPIEYTDPKLCTDNGAMIAALGAYKNMLGQEKADPYTLEIQPNLSM